jgi:hypothetical protein
MSFNLVNLNSSQVVRVRGSSRRGQLHRALREP